MEPPHQPSTPKRRHTYLSRDERFRVQILHQAGHTAAWIVTHTGFSRHQVDYAIQADRPTPKKRPGAPRRLSEEQIDELETYVCSSRATRQISYRKLARGPFSHWNVGEYVIRYALQSRGYKRCKARAKPPLSNANRLKRLEWARAHVEWELHQWYDILWSDETWVTGGRHTRIWVTRRAGEDLDDTCIIDKIRRKKGWIF